MPLARSAAALALAALAACSGSPPAPPRVQPLLQLGTLVSLGNEARWASGGTGAGLVDDEFDSAGELPTSAALPAAFARESSVLLFYRCGPGDEPAAHHRIVGVRSLGGAARVTLEALAEDCPEPPGRVRATAFRIRERPLHRVLVEAAVPEAAVLEFGYGVRSETWGADASPVRFRVLLDDGSGERQPIFDARLDPRRPADRRWYDARVDLSGWAGRAVSIVFETRREGEGGALPVWADPVLYAAEHQPAEPNLLLVSIDTLRARNLGAYGYARDTSPFLDSLAESGTLFENAITASATTAPAHMSIFTGLYPVHHGVVIGLLSAAPEVEILTPHLRGAGYHTAAFTEDGYLSLRSGFGRGFSSFVENRGERGQAPGDVARTFGQARAWLEHNRRSPFFLFVHTYQVHAPHTSPPGYEGLFAGDALPGPEDPAMRELRDAYDREIRLVDDELRRLFGALERGGWADSTLVVLLSDHGEEFLEHGLYQHGGAVFDEVLRVPLIFWGPGRVPAGRRIAAQVSLVDVAPTLLDWVGIAASGQLDGRSLRAAIEGGDEPPPRTLFAEARAGRRFTGAGDARRWNPPLVAVRSQDTKFVVHRPERGAAQPTRRFDLARDPGERTPLDPGEPESERVEALVSEYLGGAVDAGPEPEGVDPGLRERLRLLGYVE